MGQVSPIFSQLLGKRVYLDTNVFIYFLEQESTFYPASYQLMNAVNRKVFNAYTGELAVAETMIGPYKKMDVSAISQTRHFFRQRDFLSVVPHEARTFDLAARLKARHNMKFADALHFATAIRFGCTLFVTNDKAIRSSTVVRVVPLTALIP